MADADSWDTDNFEPDEPIKKAAAAAAALDRWEGEDEEEDVKDNWDDDDEKETVEIKKTEVKTSDKKKLSEKIKEKESLQRKNEEELELKSEWSEQPGDPTPTPTPTPEEQLDEKLRVKKLQEESDLELTNTPTPTPEEQLDEKLRVKKLQEESDLELTKEAFGVANNVTGIDTMSPSSKDDFAEFEKLLKEKISSYEKSVHYSTFLESLFRDLCLSLEVEDLKKISNALTVLLSEKQKQEKQSKAKKKKKGVVPGGGLKATLKDDLEDYGGFQGGYGQEFEDFM
uniref:Eukaryotic translation initiation factor 3 subunit J n=1 Tax=Paramormyrops kingsleyae TaxID=1676925 RepID=A0A3B3T4M5_9TELE|nr:eukaryotic translation initiation factor 3 subunit J-A-like isoform X1 [Paramormyrops kingsleyae]